MFHVDVEAKQLRKLSPKGFSELGLRERFDIQEWIEKTPEILGEEFLIIGKEVILASGKRLDVLAIDKEAALVIVELKRDDSGEAVEWQAIKYASYCANFLPEEIYKQFASYLEVTEKEAQQAIEEFIDADVEELNESQRIVLASRQFNSEVISAVIGFENSASIFSARDLRRSWTPMAACLSPRKQLSPFLRRKITLKGRKRSSALDLRSIENGPGIGS